MQIFVSIMIQDYLCPPWRDHINSRASLDLTINNNDAKMAKRFSQSQPPRQVFFWHKSRADCRDNAERYQAAASHQIKPVNGSFSIHQSISLSVSRNNCISSSQTRSASRPQISNKTISTSRYTLAFSRMQPIRASRPLPSPE